ncbi:hypothetical protein CCP3SC15_700012 [Gammaproteobacteria bacterium]
MSAEVIWNTLFKPMTLTHLNTLMSHLGRFDFCGTENILVILTANFPSSESNL